VTGDEGERDETPMKIFDIHTHFFGPDFFRILAARAHPSGNPEPGLGRLQAAGIEAPTGSNADQARRWLTAMNRNHLEAMVTFASIPEEAPGVAEGVRVADGRLVPFSLIDPTDPEGPARTRTLVSEHHMRGLLLFPAMHKYHPSDRSLDGFYETVSDLRLPVIAHMGVLRIRVREILGLPADFDISYANPLHLARAAERFPKVRFIIPHFGGGYFDEALAVGETHPNIALDTSSSNSWIRMRPEKPGLAGVFRRSLEVFGPGRIHFGTDSSAFPRGWRRDLFEQQRQALEELAVSPGDQERIFGANTRELLERHP